MASSKRKPNKQILRQKSSYLPSNLSYFRNVKASGYTCCYQIQYACFKKFQVYPSEVLDKYRILEYFKQTLYLIGGTIRVLGPRRVLGRHKVLGPAFPVCRK